MICTRIILIAILIFISGSNAFAQVRPDSLPGKRDTTKKVVLKTIAFSPENFNFGNRTIHDSLYYRLDSFQIVHPILLSTGNLGSPGHALLPVITPTEPFSVRPDAFAYFGFNRYNRRFYHSNAPYTLLQYFVGMKREQYVDVLHTRNFGDNLNFSFHFKRIRSEGFYNRQNTSNTSVQTNLWYKSPGKRYAFMADVFWTGANVAENGGLANDSSFEFSDQVDRQVNAVNLNQAGTVQRKRDVWMKHTFALGKVIDTIQLDSVRSRSVIMPAWGISITSELYDEKYNYTDGFPDGGFYDVIYYDSTLTEDSTYSWRVNNSVHLERFNQNGAKKLRGYIGARYEAGEYFSNSLYQHFDNIYAEGTLVWNPDSAAEVRLSGNYVVTGTNKGNYRWLMRAAVPLHFRKKTVKGVQLIAELFSQVRAADMIFKTYSGNHLRWENSFSSIEEFQARAGFVYSGTTWLKSAGIIASQLFYRGYLYFDSTFLPHQYNSDLSLSRGEMWISTQFSWLHASLKYTYNTFQNDTLLRMPEHTVMGSVFANMNLFKKAMQLQIGIDVLWFSEFAAEGYLPNVAQFYLQSTRSVGNYTYISPWVSFRIKPVRVFVKVEHANAGLMGRKYFLLDHYPANDLAVKIGISWLFSD